MASGNPSGPSAAVGFSYHPAFLRHDTGAGHPERPQRLEAIVSHLQSTDVWPKLRLLEPQPAERSTIELVHPAAYLDLIEEACREGPTALDPDTVVSPGSWEAALRAVGAVTGAIDEVAGGRLSSVFCAVRPPGHHALPTRAMGFCIFNNVAIGARYAQQRHRLSRVLIADWDVHHGNATQTIFYDDPTVLYFSVHQYPYYPGTGSRDETGRGKGTGLTVNVPLSSGCGDADVVRAFREELTPKALAFKPELILISAGFDGHRDDPLASLNLTEPGYAALTDCILDIARHCCPGRIVSALEGGYHLTALGRSVESHLRALLKAGAP